MKKSILIVLLFLIALATFLFFTQGKQRINESVMKKIVLAGQTLKVELALTELEQTQGLSGRKNLPEDTGMLFIFKKSRENYFWMKDMKFPIDIIWINEEKEVIFIEKNIFPDSFPKIFGPKKDSKYVLEVNGGFSEKNNLVVGEKIEFLP